MHIAQDSDQCGGGGSCEHKNKPSVSVKGGEFLDDLSDYWLLEKDSATYN